MVHMTWVQPRVLDLNQVNENTFNGAFRKSACAKGKTVWELREFCALKVEVIAFSSIVSMATCILNILEWHELYLIKPC